MDLAMLPDSTYKMKTVDQQEIIKDRKDYWDRFFAKVNILVFWMVQFIIL